MFRLFYTCSFSKENVKNSPCQHFDIIDIFLSFLHFSLCWSLLDLFTSVSKDIHQYFIIEMDLFSFHLITTFSF